MLKYRRFRKAISTIQAVHRLFLSSRRLYKTCRPSGSIEFLVKSESQTGWGQTETKENDNGPNYGDAVLVCASQMIEVKALNCWRQHVVGNFPVQIERLRKHCGAISIDKIYILNIWYLMSTCKAPQKTMPSFDEMNQYLCTRLTETG